MNNLVKKLHDPINQKGSGLFAVLAFLFFVATILFFVFFLAQPHPERKAKNTKTALEDAKIDRLQGEMSQLFITLGDVERMRDRRRYLEVVAAAARRLSETDVLWEKKMKSQKGLADGMMGGLNENFEAHFTRDDKFQMLSEKYAIPAGKLRSLKADFEIMFADELAEKFSPAPEENQESSRTKEAKS